jgi:methionyl-tRNA formyltransferase
MNILFFGTSNFSIYVLERLIALGIKPEGIVTVPDRPAGRKMILTAPPIKTWAITNNVSYFQFEKLNDAAVDTLEMLKPDLFIVASYGKIIPERVLQIPTHGCLNIHPSLLPKLRGATPLQTSIMQNMQYTGVSIIQMDKEMDHGPFVATHEETVTPWPQTYTELEKYLALKGAELLAENLADYISGKLIPTEQRHEDSTYCKKIEKEDGLISLDDLTGDIGWNTFLKFNALIEWPGLFFFTRKGDVNAGADIRVKVKDAVWNTALETMEITRVIPEGKKEMTWKDFLNYLKN